MLGPPPSNSLQHYLLENPWPISLVLLVAGLVIGWWGLREGLRTRVRIGAVLMFAASAVFLAAAMVTTAGEHGERVTREFVERVVAEDTVGGLSLIRDDATLNAGSPQNPGFEFDVIRRQFIALAERYDIESNMLTRLEGYSLSRDEAEIRLACLTTLAGLPYPTASQWVLRTRRGDDGEWRIARITCVAINDQTPPIDRAW